jgi:hypothetical protein
MQSRASAASHGSAAATPRCRAATPGGRRHRAGMATAGFWPCWLLRQRCQDVAEQYTGTIGCQSPNQSVENLLCCQRLSLLTLAHCGAASGCAACSGQPLACLLLPLKEGPVKQDANALVSGGGGGSSSSGGSSGGCRSRSSGGNLQLMLLLIRLRLVLHALLSVWNNTHTWCVLIRCFQGRVGGWVGGGGGRRAEGYC